jgi:hypothetical protein
MTNAKMSATATRTAAIDDRIIARLDFALQLRA